MTFTKLLADLPDAVLVQHVLRADERHLDVLSAQRLLLGEPTHALLRAQAPPVETGTGQLRAAGRSCPQTSSQSVQRQCTASDFIKLLLPFTNMW